MRQLIIASTKTMMPQTLRLFLRNSFFQSCFTNKKRLMMNSISITKGIMKNSLFIHFLDEAMIVLSLYSCVLVASVSKFLLIVIGTLSEYRLAQRVKLFPIVQELGLSYRVSVREVVQSAIPLVTDDALVPARQSLSHFY